jgi:hypothetical protein
MKKLLFLAIAAMALFSACKKKNVERTTAEKIAGPWNFKNLVYNEYYSNANHIFTTNAVSGDYFDFRADGKVYSKMASQRDTAAYSIVSDTKIKIDGLDFDIKTLTDNQFLIYNKDVINTTSYDETTLTLTR